ncbi:MAG: hypothetical protein EBT96_10755 [Betaproteobacteria bacterium]|nr:hypothetical protein [Betaproteobacteria bacterium]
MLHLRHLLKMQYVTTTTQHQRLQMFMLEKMPSVSGYQAPYVQEQLLSKSAQFAPPHLLVTGVQSTESSSL